ncbi:thioredoxin family protein [Kordia sp. YSTF-M3]|uniref:Thioredoxin family protein n=1 Tax=Kordia aestuariivivens TaxID=2759037 RepID=A0ABR7QAX7_9FLAO|nr:thioredoxin family protein [Kordia aestuariivivens]MBC8755543.1 thioredoxin family protein [Kordia aestuariivivens]
MITTDTTIKNIITESLAKATSYQTYRTLVQDLVAAGKSTGEEQTEALSNYSMLNDRRMKRLDKTTKLTEEAIAEIKSYNGDVTWLILTESWCGDAAQTMPVINKVAELNDNITLKVVLRDENEALMNEFLTNGGKSIPKLIAIDNASGDVIGNWGPRPTKATQLVNDYKAEHGTLTPEFKQDLQVWYNKDKGQNTVSDLLKLV